ncbi:protein WVD2-like 2 [Fagus crenata]
MENKPNGVVMTSNGFSHDKVHVALEISEDSIETKDYEVKEYTEENSVVEQCPENQEVPREKMKNLGFLSQVKIRSQARVHQNEKRGSCMHNVLPESAGNGVTSPLKANNTHSPQATRNSLVSEILNKVM